MLENLRFFMGQVNETIITARKHFYLGVQALGNMDIHVNCMFGVCMLKQGMHVKLQKDDLSMLLSTDAVFFGKNFTIAFYKEALPWGD